MSGTVAGTSVLYLLQNTQTHWWLQPQADFLLLKPHPETASSGSPHSLTLSSCLLKKRSIERELKRNKWHYCTKHLLDGESNFGLAWPKIKSEATKCHINLQKQAESYTTDNQQSTFNRARICHLHVSRPQHVESSVQPQIDGKTTENLAEKTPSLQQWRNSKGKGLTASLWSQQLF